jgi:5'(3')-deoxyribonucleotidase
MKKQQKLIVDMDGVLADIYKQMTRWEFQQTGQIIHHKATLGKMEPDVFPNCLQHIRQTGFFLDMPLMPNAQKVMQKLNEQYDLYVVSAATQFPNSLEEKYYWLEKHFPFISWQQLVLCGRKNIICGDIMIDDHYKNLDFFNGRTILFSQPHNYGKNDKNHERVQGWEEIGKLLAH